VGWWEDLQASVSPAATLTSLAIRFAESFKEPRPELRLELRGVSQSGGQLMFGAWVSEVANQVPALGVHLFAELEGEGVTVVSEKGGIAVETWREKSYEPGSARYEAMQGVWEAR
jgi:hypothetical protein